MNLDLLFSLLCLGFIATEVVTVFVFQEPSLLSSLQDNGLTDVMLHALLIKDVSYKLVLEAQLSRYVEVHRFMYELLNTLTGLQLI